MKIETTFTVSEFAALKKCSRSTIYNNKSIFTWIKIPGTKTKKILWDEIAQNWIAMESMKR